MPRATVAASFSLEAWSEGASDYRHDEKFSCNSSQVRAAEQRLAVQHIFIERPRASGNDTRSAEKVLEVIRDILRELCCARSLLRRRVVSRKHVPAAPVRVKKAGSRR
jgi:hypothetical protein